MKYCLIVSNNQIISGIKPCTGKELAGRGVTIFSDEEEERLRPIAESFKTQVKPHNVPTHQTAEAIKKLFESGQTKAAQEMIKRYYNVSLCCTPAIENFINTLC